MLIVSIIITGTIVISFYYLFKFFKFLWKEEIKNPKGKWGKISIKIGKIGTLILKIWIIFWIWYLIFQVMSNFSN